MKMRRTFVFTFSLSILSFCFGNAMKEADEECPCHWDPDSKVWDCRLEDLDYIPVQCWPLQKDVRRIRFESWIPGTIANDSFAHENLLNLEELELESVEQVPYDALNHLTQLTYLSMFRCHNEEVPDMSDLVNLRKLNLAENRLTEVSSFVHMTNLGELTIAINQIKELPGEFLPGAGVRINATLHANKFKQINGSSIVQVTADSRLTLDYNLRTIWCTEDERDILVEKQIDSNIDIISKIDIIRDPTDP